MAREKFQVLAKRAVGRLPAALSRRWESLQKQYRDIALMTEALKADSALLEADIDSTISEEFMTSAADGYTVAQDGTVYQKLCTCIECQAELQGMTVTDVADAMIRQKLVPREAIEGMRAKATQLEQGNQPKKLPYELLN